MSLPRPPRITLLYHFFPPDDVVSAQQFGGLALGLWQRGWQVEVLTSNRLCHGNGTVGPPRERWRGGLEEKPWSMDEADSRANTGKNLQLPRQSRAVGPLVHRLWRPELRQDRGRGRIVNAAWMIASWCRLAFRRGQRRPDLVLCGTDPVFSATVAGVLKRLAPPIRQVQWAFDLYPEAAVADELFKADSRLVRWTRRLMQWAYRSFDLIVDIGPRMRERIAAYAPGCRQVTLTPWALVEPAEVPPPDAALRSQLFGTCRLALLYSGSFGRPHEFVEFLELARRLRDDGVVLGFAARGRRLEELRAALRPNDQNIRLLPFAAEAELERHLAAADVHLASLRANWTGIVVPSKFFGSLALGRPVLYAGEPDADLARWIREEQVGWVLTRETLGDARQQLLNLAQTPDRLRQLQLHCHAVYQRRFRRELILDQFDHELRRLLPSDAGGSLE